MKSIDQKRMVSVPLLFMNNCCIIKVPNTLLRCLSNKTKKYWTSELEHKAMRSNIYMYIHSSMGQIPVSTCNERPAKAMHKLRSMNAKLRNVGLRQRTAPGD